MGLNRKLLTIGGSSPSYPTSFSATSTGFARYHDYSAGAAYNAVDGYLYTLERDESDGNKFDLIRRNATTGAFISSQGKIGTDFGGLDFDSNGYAWVVQRSSNSVVRKYNTSAVYQNVQFNVTGFYADDVAIDDNDIFYVVRNSSSTIYSYNISGVGQGNFNLGSNGNVNIVHAGGKLWVGDGSSTWYGRTIATSTNEDNFTNNNPYGYDQLWAAAYIPDIEILWNRDNISGTVWGFRKYTANF